MAHPITLFYVYAESDEALRRQLEKHLALLRRQGVIAGWEPILAGAPWAEQTEQVFNKVELILLLVSADFVASEVCYKEHMQQALEREHQGKVQMVPILLRPVDWKSAPFAHLQVLLINREPVTNWPNQDTAFAQVAEGIWSVGRKAVAFSCSCESGSHIGLRETSLDGAVCTQSLLHWGK